MFFALNVLCSLVFGNSGSIAGSYLGPCESETHVSLVGEGLRDKSFISRDLPCILLVLCLPEDLQGEGLPFYLSWVPLS